MKSGLFLIVSPLVVLAGMILFQNQQPVITPPVNSSDTASCSVVELFTSEGCSSCPAADLVLADVATAYKNKIIVLGFHVDYWNRLGWKDRFSDAGYSERQQRYAAVNHSQQVYTPQAIVNGKDEMVGSDKKRLIKTIEENIHAQPKVPIEISASQAAGNVIAVNYSFQKNTDQALNIALLQTDAVTQVKGGENNRLTLHHINIVREFKTVPDAKGKLMLNLPEGLSAKNCSIVGYVQDTKTMNIVGATSYHRIL